MKTTAIVLASGMSKRMGEKNKLLLPVQSKPIILHVVNALIQSPISEILLVLGYDQSKVESLLPNHQKFRILGNADFHKGMSTSIKTGVQHLEEGMQGCFICLGDMPFLTGEDYTLLYFEVKDKYHSKLIMAPAFQDKRGHPVFFGQAYYSQLRTLPDFDEGAKSIIKQHGHFLKIIEFPNDHIIRDVDNYQDLHPIK